MSADCPGGGVACCQCFRKALHLKAAPSTDLILESVKETVPLSVSRREDIDNLRATAEGRFVSVK